MKKEKTKREKRENLQASTPTMKPGWGYRFQGEGKREIIVPVHGEKHEK